MLKKELDEKNAQYRNLQDSYQEQRKQIEDLQAENKKNDELIKIMSKQTLGIPSIPRSSILSPTNTNSQYQYRPSFKSQHPNLITKTSLSPSSVNLSPSVINPVN